MERTEKQNIEAEIAKLSGIVAEASKQLEENERNDRLTEVPCEQQSRRRTTRFSV